MTETAAAPGGGVSSDEDLVHAFCEDCRLRQMPWESIRHYRSVLRIFVRFLAGRGLDLRRADRGDVRDYLAAMVQEGLKTKTLENRLSCLSAFYDWLVYEERALENPVLPIRKRYLRTYKKENAETPRSVPSVEALAGLVNSIVDPKARAIVVLLAKTGIRRGEMIAIDQKDIDWNQMSILLKPKRKRSNRLVFFDPECASVLQEWLRVRRGEGEPLFTSGWGNRLDRTTAWNLVVTWAKRAGIDLSPHDLRHWNTTWLLRNGMRRDYVKWLRGDSLREPIDIYHHVDPEEVRRAYLAAIPKLGIT